MVAEVGRDARAGGDDPDEVERVAGREADDIAHRARAADGTERLERLGQRELLADEAVDQAAAADLAAHLQAAIDADQIAPRGRPGLPRQQIAEDHPVAPQVEPRHRLAALLLPFALRRPERGAEQGPAA